MFSTRKERPAAALTRFSPLLHLIIISALCFLAYASTAAADIYAVSNESEVPVRSGQGTEYKIVSLLQNGEKVVSLEEDGYWSKVRTATGREGWVLNRYLSTTPSIDDALSLPTTNNETNKQAEKIRSMTEQPPSALQPEENGIPETLQSPEPFDMENSKSLQIEEMQKKADKEIEEIRNKLAEVTIENKVLRENERIKWFLIGGGVLLIGWIIGLITCKERRRKLSLL